MNPIHAALADLEFAPEVAFENLTMVPLLAKPDPGSRSAGPGYLLLDDALASGAAEITEISERGSVPELRFVNRGGAPVLIVDGQELLGAKQNRVVNLTILAPPETTLTIPVSCVESGRWHARSAAFRAAPRTQYASGRAKRVAQVTASILDRGEHASDQAEVWSDIAYKATRLEASSATSAMEAIFDRHSSFIERCVDALKPFDDQVGVIFCINKSPVALDLFDRTDTLRRIFPKLVRGIAVDALDASEPLPDLAVYPRVHQLFLAHIAETSWHSAKALGLGDDVRLSSSSITGAALVVDDEVVHLSAFQRA